MGKCVSKQPSAITLAASNEYLTSKNHNNNNNNNFSNCSSSGSHRNQKKYSNSLDYNSKIQGISIDPCNNDADDVGDDGGSITTNINNKNENFLINENGDNNTNNYDNNPPDETNEKSKNNKNKVVDYINDKNLWNSHNNIIDDYKYNNIKKDVGKLFINNNGITKSSKKNKNLENNDGRIKKGQSESKKKSKNGVAETKGTAMSFGFRKKLHTTPKKKNLFKDKSNKQYQQNLITANNVGELIDDNLIDDEQIKQEQFNEKFNSSTVISNSGLIKTNDFEISDNNGNDGTIDFTDKSEKTWATMNRSISPSLQNTNNSQNDVSSGGVVQQTGGQVYKNRFGFRTANVVRPASTGITPKMTDFQENIENNNNSVKRRSKSASGANSTRSVTSNRTNNDQSQPHTANQVRFDDVPKINHIPSVNNSEYYQWKQPERKPYGGHTLPPQHHTQYYGGYPSSGTYNNRYLPPQHTIINTGMHTNIIVKPTAKPMESTTTSMGKFTLHTASLPKPQYPVPISLTTTTTTNLMDTKNAKQMANNNRKGFCGPRDISTDSGISSLDTTFDSQQQLQQKLNCNNNGGLLSPKKLNKTTRPRNLEMVINGRHKFEVRDLDTISCESIEPLSLPKLPSVFSSNNQPVPLSGLVRTNTTLSRESQQTTPNEEHIDEKRKTVRVIADSESVEEEKLYRDRSTVEKDTNKNRINGNNSSKNSSPGSSRASWCNAGESLAFKDCSSISSSDDSKDHQNEKTFTDGDLSSINLDEKPSFLLSFTESVPMVPKPTTNIIDNKINNNCRPISERPQTLSNINDTKFAEMAAAVTDILLDDETSPTDSLVSSTESEDAMLKKTKKKLTNEDLQEKDIDEISPELDICSPISPGTPTHASNSLSLSDIGKDFLIDDEIADQPALLFNDKANDNLESTQLGNSLTDTPTLMEIGCSGSKRSPKSLSKSRNLMQAAIELSLRTPISLRKATLLSKAESLDTLSPCESIASDDLMMDFETSSMDSIDRISHSMRSGNGSAMQAFEDAEIFAELENKGSDMIREWNNILRVHRTGRDSIISHLPARATRLLNRSRLQQAQLNNSNAGSDSPKSGDSFNRKLPSSRASSVHFSNRDTNSSSDDLLLHDKSFRNSMIQDVLYFKKQLMRLRRILQETDTLNPFDVNNGQFFGTSCGYDKNNSIEQHKQQQLQQLDNEKNLGSLQSLTDDPLQELADLRRQVVYLQGQVDDRDRTIRFQKNIIDKLESDNEKSQTISASTSISEKEVVNSATQTERVRPLSIGQEGLARSKPEYTSYTINHLPITTTTEITEISPITNQQQTSRRHTVISTTFTNLNQIQSPRRSSIGWDKLQYKPVKTTLIGEPLNSSPIQNNKTNNCNGNINGTSINNNLINNNCTLKSTINNNCNSIEKLQNSPTYLNGYHKQQNGDGGNNIVENMKLQNGNIIINNNNINSDNLNGGNNNNGNSINLKVMAMNETSVKCNLNINNNNNKNGFDKTQKNTEICNKINSVTIV